MKKNSVIIILLLALIISSCTLSEGESDSNKSDEKIDTKTSMQTEASNTADSENELNEHEQISEVNKIPGIALTFDDHTIDNWYESKELFAKHGVKATFFISKMDTMDSDQIAKLKELENQGHEIGCHSANHLHAKKFIENNSISNYIHHEILPALDVMRENKFEPNSFAYPFGSRTDDLDQALINEFSILRGTAQTKEGIRVKDLDKVFVDPNEHHQVIYGVGIDEVYGNTLSEIFEGIDRAKEKKEVLVLYAHLIGEPKLKDKYIVSKEKLENIILYAKENNIKFYTVSELSGSVYE